MGLQVTAEAEYFFKCILWSRFPEHFWRRELLTVFTDEGNRINFRNVVVSIKETREDLERRASNAPKCFN
jgi:hypothetical protein